jgi:hypothetical protein
MAVLLREKERIATESSSKLGTMMMKMMMTMMIMMMTMIMMMIMMMMMMISGGPAHSGCYQGAIRGDLEREAGSSR